jgi:hypothetical protein
MKVYEGNGCIDPCFLTLALVAGEWLASHPNCLTPDPHWIEGWIGLMWRKEHS